MDELLNAIKKELEIRKECINRQPVSTIYFGGGTPSLLKHSQLAGLLETISMHYQINPNPEITLEANPEDISIQYIKDIVKLGINRLSIGIQSFYNEDLHFMNRVHNSLQAGKSIMIAREGGINNINIDLIYGFPGLTLEKWHSNLEKFKDFDLEHLSAYHLVYEPGTIFYHRKRKGRIQELEDELSLDQLRVLMKVMKSAGYIHYEISNFAKEKFISRHNLGYWTQMEYLGIGPSAHSFDGQSRRWNISRNISYIRGVNTGTGYYKSEALDTQARYHEYVLTSLRTMWGTDLSYLLSAFGRKYYNHFLLSSDSYIKRGELARREEKVFLTETGIFISDHIIRDLFID